MRRSGCCSIPQKPAVNENWMMAAAIRVAHGDSGADSGFHFMRRANLGATDSPTDRGGWEYSCALPTSEVQDGGMHLLHCQSGEPGRCGS